MSFSGSQRALCAFAVLCLCSVVNAAWVVRSQQDNAWATGLGRYDPLRRVMAVSTVFHDGTDQVQVVGGMMDTDCEVLLADGTGHWETLKLEHPQLCVGGTVVMQDGQGTGIVVGIDGDDFTLVVINDIGTANPTRGNVVKIGNGKIPVAVHRGHDQDTDIFVAFHDINGFARFNGFGATREENLLNMMAYWDRYTDPRLLAQDQGKHSPHVLKINPITGVITWLGIYETQEDSTSTIAAMEHADFQMIYCGTTNGIGDTFGFDEDGTFDGYVTWINAVTGQEDKSFFSMQDDRSIDRPAVRIKSEGGPPANEIVHDMCFSGDNLFVVGTTDGQFTDDAPQQGGPFVARVNLLNREITGRIHLTGENRTGLKIVCTGTHFYVAGHVEYDNEPQDIYAVSYTLDMTQVQWDVLLDSTPYFGDERRDQLVDIDVNPAGDVTLLLNSQKLDQGINDMLYLDLQSDTGMNEIQKGATAGAEGGIPEGGIELEPDLEDGNNDIEDDNNDASAAIQAEIKKMKEEDKEKQRSLALGLGFGVPLILGVIIFAFARSSREKGIEKVKPQEMQVTEELPAGKSEVV